MIEDAELLREFARDRSEKAFAELVRRHLDLVYGFALRRVGGDAHSADDVTQRVFADLARKAASLQDRASLAGWLYTSTRFAAADLVRSAQRRRQHERQAHAMHTLHAAPPLDWEKLRPVLDEVMDQLGEADREAVLLRFFEGRPLAEVGAKLATSEDAARMRVDRALDKLRALLARRGFTSTSTALATILAHQPLVAAPAALAGTISAAVIAALPAVAVAGAQTVALTTLQKSLAATVLALGLGAGVYQATIYARQTSDLAAFTRRETDLAAQLRTTRTQHAALTAHLKSVEAQIDTRLAATTSRTSGDAALAAQIDTWFANLDQLKQTLAQRPELNLPELTLLSAEAWFDTATKADLRTEAGVRRALADLRNQAMTQAGAKLGGALSAFVTAHRGALPADISDLAPHLPTPLDASWLGRYAILNSNLVPDLPTTVRPNEFMIARALLDPEHDKCFLIGIYATVAFDPPLDPPTRDSRTNLTPHPNLPANVPALSFDPQVGTALRHYYGSHATAAPTLPAR